MFFICEIKCEIFLRVNFCFLFDVWFFDVFFTAINVNTGKDYIVRVGTWLVVMNFPIYHAWKVIFVALAVCFTTVQATTSNAAYLTVAEGNFEPLKSGKSN